MKYGILFAFLFLASCRSSRPIDFGTGNSPIPSGTITQSLENQQDHTQKIENLNADNAKLAKEIEKSSDAASNTTDALFPAVSTNTQATDNLKKIKEELDKIQQNSSDIGTHSAQIKDGLDAITKETTSIYANVKQVKGLETEIAKLRTEKESLKNDAIKSLYSSLSIFFGIGFATILAGIFLAIFVNKTLGMSVLAVGVLGLALAAGCVFYLQTIAMVAMYIIIGSILVAGAFVIWHLMRQVHKVNDLHTANVENVQLVQTVKEKLDPDIKEEVFGEHGIAKEIQSDVTQKLVKEIKQKILATKT